MPTTRRRVLRLAAPALGGGLAGCAAPRLVPSPTPTCRRTRVRVTLANDAEAVRRLAVAVVRQPDGPAVYEGVVTVAPGATVDLDATDRPGSYDVDVRLLDTGASATASVHAGRDDCSTAGAQFRATPDGDVRHVVTVVLE